MGKDNLHEMPTAMIITVPAQIVEVKTMRDGGVRIIADTQEITDSEDLMRLFQLKKEGIGWLAYKNVPLKEEDIPEYDPEQNDEELSPSQRFRSILYVYFTRVLKKDPKDFNSYYVKFYNQLSEKYKEKLPPKN